MVTVPKIWSHIKKSSAESEQNYLIGLVTNIKEISYTLFVTDLTSKYWIEHVSCDELRRKLDLYGIKILEDSKLVEFLSLLQTLVDKNEGVEISGDSSNPQRLEIRLNTAKLNWGFFAQLSTASNDEFDQQLKFRLFNSAAVHQSISAELTKQLATKDRIIQVLLENFLELNNSYSSSLEDESEMDFINRVNSNKQIKKMFPASSNLHKALLRFDSNSLDLPADTRGIWSRINSVLKDRKVWALGNVFTEQDEQNSHKTKQPMQASDSEFVNLDDVKANTEAKAARDLDARELLVHKKKPTSETRGESPTKVKIFGVVGTTNRKRRLRAGSTSPMKVPKFI